MAKKKSSHQENQLSQREKPIETMEENQTGKLKSLKSLNDLLIKETFERREQVDTLMKSKKELESEVNRSEMEKQSLEKEKEVLEEKAVVDEIEKSLTLVFIGEQIEQQEERLKEKIWREKAEMEEKMREIEQVSGDFRGYRHVVQKEIDLKQKEVDRLRLEVEELEKSNVEVKDEIGMVKRETDRVLEEKVEIEKKFKDLNGEMVSVVKQKSEIEQAKIDQDLQISNLQMAVEFLNGDLTKERFAMEGVVCERDQIRKSLDGQIKEAEKMKQKLVELERSNLALQEDVNRLRTERNVLFEERVEKEKALESVAVEISSMEKRLAVSTELIDDLRRDMERIARDKEEIEFGRDKIQMSLDSQIEEGEELKQKLLELERSNLGIHEKLSHVETERNGLFVEREERERTLESVSKEKLSVERSLAESSKLIADLKRDIEQIVRDKENVVRQRDNQVIKISELEKEVEGLRSSVSTLQREEGGLRNEVAELSKSNVEALGKQQELQLEIQALVEKVRESERLYELLMEEKKSVVGRLEGVLSQSKTKADEIMHKMAEIEQEKIKLEAENAELHKDVSGLKEAVSSLQDSCRAQIEVNNKLRSEAKENRDALASVTLERDEVRRVADIKKEEEERLRLEVIELEKSFVETQHELEHVRLGMSHFSEEKKVFESHIELLTKEKVSMERSMLDAEKDNKDLQAKVKSAEICAEQTLRMLKSTVEMICATEDAEIDGKGELGINAEKFDDEIQPFVAELETIKRAFKDKEVKVGDMKQQLELLKHSVVEVQKKRNFWTWLSSATTILAAASVAYVTRAR